MKCKCKCKHKCKSQVTDDMIQKCWKASNNINFKKIFKTCKILHKYFKVCCYSTRASVTAPSRQNHGDSSPLLLGWTLDTSPIRRATNREKTKAQFSNKKSHNYLMGKPSPYWNSPVYRLRNWGYKKITPWFVMISAARSPQSQIISSNTICATLPDLYVVKPIWILMCRKK